MSDHDTITAPATSATRGLRWKQASWTLPVLAALGVPLAWFGTASSFKGSSPVSLACLVAVGVFVAWWVVALAVAIVGSRRAADAGGRNYRRLLLMAVLAPVVVGFTVIALYAGMVTLMMGMM